MAESIETYFKEDNQYIRRIKLRDGGYFDSAVPALNGVDTISAADFDRSWLNLDTKPVSAATRGTARLVDLFSGTGPMTLGVVEAGRAVGVDVQPVFAIDFVKDAADNYKRNFPQCRVENADVNDYIDGELGTFPSKAEQQLLSEIGPIDIVIGGPPCQGHSDLNNYTRRDDPRMN